MIKYPMIYKLYGLKLDWDDKIPNDLQALGVSNWIGMIKYPMIYKLYGLKLDWDDKIPNDLQALGSQTGLG